MQSRDLKLVYFVLMLGLKKKLTCQAEKLRTPEPEENKVCKIRVIDQMHEEGHYFENKEKSKIKEI